MLKIPPEGEGLVAIARRMYPPKAVKAALRKAESEQRKIKALDPWTRDGVLHVSSVARATQILGTKFPLRTPPGMGSRKRRM